MMNQIGDQKFEQAPGPAEVTPSEWQELKLNEAEHRERHQIVDDLLAYSHFLRETSDSHIHDEQSKTSRWREYHQDSGEWRFTLLHETNHIMLERCSQNGKRRFYCIDGDEKNLWGVAIADNYEQIPLFVSTNELKRIRGVFRGISNSKNP